MNLKSELPAKIFSIMFKYNPSGYFEEMQANHRSLVHYIEKIAFEIW